MFMDHRYNLVWDPVTREASSLPPLPSEFATVRGYFLTERGIVLSVDENVRFFFTLMTRFGSFPESNQNQMNPIQVISRI